MGSYQKIKVLSWHQIYNVNMIRVIQQKKEKEKKKLPYCKYDVMMTKTFFKKKKTKIIRLL